MSTPIKTAVIGIGGLAKNVHLPALNEIDTCEIVALCDHREERAREQAGVYGIKGVYSSFFTLLENEEFEAAFVITPPESNFLVANECLKAGKHVFVEKPPALNLFETESLKRTCADHPDLVFQAGYNRRLIPVVEKTLEIVRQHTDSITQVRGTFFKQTGAAFCDGSGSSFFYDLIHSMDLVRWVAGGEPVQTVLMESQFGDVVPNCWNGLIRFDNGAIGIIESNYNTGGRVHSLEVFGPGVTAVVNMGFGDSSCSSEILTHEGGKAYSISAAGNSKTNRVSLNGIELAGRNEFYAYYGFLQEDTAFFKSILDGTTPLNNIDEAVKTMALAEKLMESRI